MKKKGFLMPPHPLTKDIFSMNLNSKALIHEIIYQISRKMGRVVNLNEYESTGTHWISLYVNSNTATYFVTFGIEHIPEEIKKFIDNKNITANISRV